MRLDVRSHGAVGDGVTDDGAAIQAALDAVAAGGATGVYLPAGNYRVTRPLVFRPAFGRAAVIRGESGSPGGGGSTLVFDGPPGAPCVLEVAGGFGVELSSFKIDARGKAQFGLYLHDRLPEAGMSDVTIRDVSVGSPLAGDSPLLGTRGKSAAISIGLRPDGTQDVGQCDGIRLDSVTLASTGDAHAAHYGVATGTANVKNVHVVAPWTSGFHVAFSIPNGTGSFAVFGGWGTNHTEAEFLLGSGSLVVVGYESEGSRRLLTTPGWHSGVASASFERCQWYGGPADDLAVLFCGSLSLRGCDLWNARTAASLPRIGILAPQFGSVASLELSQCTLRNALAHWADAGGHPVLVSGGGPAPLVVKGKPAPAWLRAFGCFGGVAGALVTLDPIN